MSPSYRQRNIFARKLANVRTLHISLDATLAYHCLASPCGTAIIRRKSVNLCTLDEILANKIVFSHFFLPALTLFTHFVQQVTI